MEQPLISIITLNWNQTDITCSFLDSIRKLDYPRLEVIVCEMGSSIDPEDKIHPGKFPFVRLVRCEKNLGISGGINRGLLSAKGEYFLIIRNDTTITSSLVYHLLYPFSSDPTVGIVCPKICYKNDPKRIKYAGMMDFNIWTGRHRFPGKGEYDEGQYDSDFATSYAHNAAMMIRRTVVEKVGMFYEPFFVYYQDMDWSARILKAGYKILYHPRAVVYQLDESRQRDSSPLKIYYITRNRIMYMRRQVGAIHFALFLLYFVCCYTPYSLLRFSSNRQFSHVRSYVKGALWHLGV
jgi:GT2 family glycosyltransferase